MPSLYTPEISGSSIVAIGDFNPSIFTPDWLHRNHLIGDGDLEVALSSESTLTSRRVSVCEVDWFNLQVIENRLMLVSKGALTPALRDLAEGLFLLVPQTPITALGINFHSHYRMANAADRHKVGDVLAPKVVWEDLFDTAKYSIGLADLKIQIQDGARGDEEHPPDLINIEIQPSILIQEGIYMTLNNHRVSFAKGADGHTAAERAADLIAHEWEQVWEFAMRTFEDVLRKALSS